MEFLIYGWLFFGVCFGIAGAINFWGDFGAAHNIAAAALCIFIGPIVFLILCLLRFFKEQP